MNIRHLSRRLLSSDLAVLVLLAVAWVLVFVPINEQYGFHRDELAFVDNARHLDWGYIEYPPLTPLIGRLALVLFGPSLVGLRLFASLAIGAVLVLVGLMARELGGSRKAQIIAGLAAVSAPITMSHASFFSYETFDYLFWVLMVYCVLRLLCTSDPRWWLGIGTAIGLGMMTKYTTVFAVAGLAAGVLLTPLRRYLKSPWLWAGAALAVLICLPNLIWQVHHGFISLRFLTSIHARDVAIGRTSLLDFVIGQFIICTSGAAIYLWIRGLRFYLFSPEGKPYRAMGWMFVVPLVLFALAQGRFYYPAPAYPALIAAGVALVVGRGKELSTDSAEQEVPGSGLNGLEEKKSVQSVPQNPLTAPPKRGLLSAVNSLPGWLIIVGLMNAALTLPLAPIGSGWFNVSTAVNGELKEQIGWPELTAEVARIYQSVPAAERAGTGILTGNYGEAGAINLYGPGYGLPTAISGIDTYWLRGYGNSPPKQVIVLGYQRAWLGDLFSTCQLAGHTPNPYGVKNEETVAHPEIYLCRDPRLGWPEFWKKIQSFG